MGREPHRYQRLEVGVCRAFVFKAEGARARFSRFGIFSTMSSHCYLHFFCLDGIAKEAPLFCVDWVSEPELCASFLLVGRCKEKECTMLLPAAHLCFKM